MLLSDEEIEAYEKEVKKLSLDTLAWESPK